MKLNLLDELINSDLDKVTFQTSHFLIKAEHISQIPYTHPKAYRNDFFCISLLYNGEASHGPSTETLLVKAPAILLHEKGEMPVHFLSADCRIVSLYFTEHFLVSENVLWNTQLNRVFINKVVKLTESQLIDFRAYIDLITYEYQKNDATAPAIIGYLLMIVFKIISEFKTGTNYLSNLSTSRLSYFQFKSLVNLHFKKQHQVQAYADRLCMTAEMLGKAVKDAVNKTPKQVIDERLIAEAKKMLAWTNISNKEIAYQLGFESDSYFNRYFKKHCHQTPLNFRQKAVQSIVEG